MLQVKRIMASACHCILFLTLLVAGYLCDATDYNILDYGIARKHELWMAKYGRVYKDEAEKARRFEIYKKNIKYIEDFNNAGEHKYTLGEGPFTDLTTEEFLATYTTTGGIKIPEGEMVEGSLRSNKFKTMNPINYTSLPSTVDWRAKGAVTPVRFQANCGKKSFLRVMHILFSLSLSL